MTPMIDMVFQLIAFFMVLINFTDNESNDDVVLPHSELAKPPDGQMENVIFIHLTADEHVILAGEKVSLDGVDDFLRRERGVLESGGVQAADATIIIRAHQFAKTGHVQRLIKACQTAGFIQFALRAKENTADGLAQEPEPPPL